MGNTKKQNFQQEVQKLIRNASLFSHQERVPIASVNNGVVHTLLPAVRGFKYHIRDWVIAAVGGTTAAGTSLIMKTTQGGSVNSVTIALAQLARGVLNLPNSTATYSDANDKGIVTNDCDAGTAVTIEASGTFSGNTHFYVSVAYTLEKA